MFAIIPFVFAIFLPLCKNGQKFPTQCYKIAWIFNIVGLLLYVIWIIIAVHIACKFDDNILEIVFANATNSTY